MASCSAPVEAPSEGHLVVTIDTDAPLPSASGATAGVFDSIYLEVLRPDGLPACSDCVRELGLLREQVEGGASFVVRAERPALLRARLFDSRRGVAAFDAAVVIEHWVRLPGDPAEGATQVTVRLPLDQVGIPLGSLGEPTAAGDPGARLAPQPDEVTPRSTRPGEVCVSGGWFWMGDPRLPPDGERTANIPRLVHIASFCVDDHELTVGELRASGVDVSGVPLWSGSGTTTNLASFCAFTSAPGPNDDRAVNCVPWATAREVCRLRGMDLPTEAQLEYLGTSFGRSSFVWGAEPPACDGAFVGRAVPPLAGDGACTRGRDAILPASAADLAKTRDVLKAPGGPMFGLASNVSEWTREAFEPRTSSCRGPAAGPARDPECVAVAGTTRIAVRGGNLTSTPAEAAAALRAYVALPRVRADLGLRCVR